MADGLEILKVIQKLLNADGKIEVVTTPVAITTEVAAVTVVMVVIMMIIPVMAKVAAGMVIQKGMPKLLKKVGETVDTKMNYNKKIARNFRAIFLLIFNCYS
jgi:hypothetical protein